MLRFLKNLFRKKVHLYYAFSEISIKLNKGGGLSDTVKITSSNTCGFKYPLNEIELLKDTIIAVLPIKEVEASLGSDGISIAPVLSKDVVIKSISYLGRVPVIKEALNTELKK